MRFTQQDTHWNTSNIIYGDNPQKINEREDKLGLKTYSYAPQISAVVQSGNLYVYAVGNPVMYADEDGEMAKLVKAAIHGAINGIIAAMTSDANEPIDYFAEFIVAFGEGFITDYFELDLVYSILVSTLDKGILSCVESKSLTEGIKDTPDAFLSSTIEGFLGNLVDEGVESFISSAVGSEIPQQLMECFNDDTAESLKIFFSEIISSLFDLGESNEK